MPARYEFGHALIRQALYTQLNPEAIVDPDVPALPPELIPLQQKMLHIFVQEATGLDDQDWQILLTRLRPAVLR
jgi:hypothetical protein